MYVSVGVYMCVPVSACIDVWMFLYIYVCGCMYLSVFACPVLLVCICVFLLSVQLHNLLNIVCACVRVCLCVSTTMIDKLHFKFLILF